MTGRSGPRAARREQDLRVVTFPRPLATNPYQRLLLDALAARGVVEVDADWPLSPVAVWRARREVDVVHLHWLELLAFAVRPRFAGPRDLLRSARVLAALVVLALVRVRLVWTVHNPRPHETSRPRLYRLLARATALAADAVLVHSEDAAERVRRDLRPRGTVFVARHGPYTDWYPRDERPRDEQRAALGLPADAFVLLLFGMVRPYKRVPEALRAFAAVPGDGLRLVVAGTVLDEALRSEVEALAAADPRVVQHLRWIDDEEVATFHGAADAVVLNHREIFSSGALILAWSFGLPAVAPGGPTLEELARPGAVEAFDEGGLSGALERIQTGDQEQRRAAALASAGTRSWDAMADAVLLAYGASHPADAG